MYFEVNALSHTSAAATEYTPAETLRRRAFCLLAILLRTVRGEHADEARCRQLGRWRRSNARRQVQRRPDAAVQRRRCSASTAELVPMSVFRASHSNEHFISTLPLAEVPKERSSSLLSINGYNKQYCRLISPSRLELILSYITINVK